MRDRMTAKNFDDLAAPLYSTEEGQALIEECRQEHRAEVFAYRIGELRRELSIDQARVGRTSRNESGGCFKTRAINRPQAIHTHEAHRCAWRVSPYRNNRPGPHHRSRPDSQDNISYAGIRKQRFTRSGGLRWATGEKRERPDSCPRAHRSRTPRRDRPKLRCRE